MDQLKADITAAAGRFAAEIVEIQQRHYGARIRDLVAGFQLQPADVLKDARRFKSWPVKPEAKRSATDKFRRRSPEELDALTARLAEHVVQHPGQRIEQIGKALNASTADLTWPMKRLITGGIVKCHGLLRATSYWPNTPTPMTIKPKAKAKVKAKPKAKAKVKKGGKRG